jgi:Na+-translocating ferredoxin:NAD+ oxidoreductase RnfD subunit
MSALTTQRFFKTYREMDPRIPVAAILFIYLILGLTILGFNRTPWQALTTTITCCAFDLILTKIYDKKWVQPLSALITSLSLSFLLNYSHDFFLLFIPIFFAIGSKHVIRFKNKHALNPAMVGVSLSLLLSSNLVTAAPAYQWNGISSMSIFVITLGLLFVMPKVNRIPLVLSFLFTFTILTALRAFIMRHHLPFETLFLGTLSSPSFFIFTFFMITDPATSPSDRKQQIIVGVSLAVVDLLLHLRQSYYTFFFAALIVGTYRVALNHFRASRAEGWALYSKRSFFLSGYYKRPLSLGLLALVAITVYGQVISPHLSLHQLDWTFERVPSEHSHLVGKDEGEVYKRLDQRIVHVAKWILSVGDSVSAADIDNDGLQDIFLTNVLKKNADKNALYRNLGNYQFERIPLPQVEEINHWPEKLGLVSNAIFADYDNDGDQDLFLVVAFGHSQLLKNQLKETGKLSFQDVSHETHLADSITTSISASFGDFNRDGLLDLIILNVWPEYLPDYQHPTRLNLFHLPLPENENDQRMFNFMHNSWHLSNNGGENWIYLQTPDHKFLKQDSKKWGLPETRWSLSVGIADFNHDEWPDLYIANDFGPDDLYFNVQGRKFQNIKGNLFGDIGKDTYKGMNVSVADFDHSQWQDIYVTNVHHAFQAEGSLLWSFRPSENPQIPLIEEVATHKSALNENRFGWGASATDFDNDGWVDIAIANGMVDDTWDKKFEDCPDYWYVNEKVARSPPSIHRYANKWGDLRGYCIYGKEKNRIYLNRGPEHRPQFVDVAEVVGVTEDSNSRGACSVDLMNHGRRDIIFTRPFNEPLFYKNIMKGSAVAPSWIGLNLVSREASCNREGIGSRIIATITQRDGSQSSIAVETQVVSGLASQNDKRPHFGLGKDAQGVSFQVKWCNQGPWVAYSQLSLNQYHEITQP